MWVQHINGCRQWHISQRSSWQPDMPPLSLSLQLPTHPAAKVIVGGFQRTGRAGLKLMSLIQLQYASATLLPEHRWGSFNLHIFSVWSVAKMCLLFFDLWKRSRYSLFYKLQDVVCTVGYRQWTFKSLWFTSRLNVLCKLDEAINLFNPFPSLVN